MVSCLDSGGFGLWSTLESGHGFTFSTDGETNTPGERYILALGALTLDQE